MRGRGRSGRRGAVRFALGFVVALTALPASVVAHAEPFMKGTAEIVAHDAARFPATLPAAPALPVARRGGSAGASQEHNPPTIPTGFAAVADAGSVAPPDASGAVGPAHVMSVTSQDIVVHSRTGTVISTTALQAWWASLDTPVVFDPHAFYDPYGGRFVFVAAADPGVASSDLLLAVTATSDPTGTWYRYRIDDKGGTTEWADAPVAGFSGRWITIQVGMMRISNGTLARSRIFSIDKADVYANGDNRMPYGDLLGLGTAQVPALTYDPNVMDQWLLQNWNGNSGGQGQLRMYRLTGTVDLPQLEVRPFVTAYTTWASIPPSGGDILPQAGTAAKINSGDARMRSVVYRGGSLYAAQTAFLPAAAPARAVVQWWEVATTTSAVRQAGRIEDASGATMYAYPSIAVNQTGDVVVASNRFSTTEHPGAIASFHYGIEPPGTMRTPMTTKAGAAPYVRPVLGVNRWGDYSSAQVDPVDNDHLWTIQPYAASADRWGTWWSAIKPNPAPALEVAPGSLSFGYVETGSNSASENVTITSAGQQPAVIGAITIAGTDGSQFAIHGSTCGGQTLQPGQSCVVGVRFSPATAGSKSAQLVVASNAPAAPPPVALSGIAVPPGPHITVTPTSIAFGNQDAGSSSAPVVVTVTNSGVGTLQPGPLTLEGANPTHFATTADTCTGASLTAGQSCTVGVVFAPVVTGSLGARLRIDANTWWSPDFVTLSGIGVPPGGVPGGSFSPSNLSFGGVHVGTSSPEGTARLVNTGTGPLALGTVRIEGPEAPEFRLSTNDCTGATVNPGAWCTVGVVFTSAGLRSSTATLRIPSNAPSREHALVLSGTGVDMHPPWSTITTGNGEILFGIGLNIVVSTLGVDNAVTGTATDDLSGVRRVDVTFRGTLEARTVSARIACNAPQTSCTWSAVVPSTPGEYSVTVKATDLYGNVEGLGPSVRVYVV